RRENPCSPLLDQDEHPHEDSPSRRNHVLTTGCQYGRRVHVGPGTVRKHCQGKWQGGGDAWPRPLVLVHRPVPFHGC
ncbi:hypothetical protein LEMLEM_LOCUS21340, partial [Lemmus lemmus]